LIEQVIERLEARPQLLTEKIPEFEGGLNSEQINRLACLCYRIGDSDPLPIEKWVRGSGEGKPDRLLVFNPQPGSDVPGPREFVQWSAYSLPEQPVPIVVAQIANRLRTWVPAVAAARVKPTETSGDDDEPAVKVSADDSSVAMISVKDAAVRLFQATEAFRVYKDLGSAKARISAAASNDEIMSNGKLGKNKRRLVAASFQEWLRRQLAAIGPVKRRQRHPKR